MIVLAFDTAMNAGSVVVAQDGTVLARSHEPDARSLAEQLVPMVEETLKAAGHTYQSIDRIGVTIGPGTFTGMRIGMAAARSMALAADKPLIGVSTLEVVARQAAIDHGDESQITTCFDARRGEVYLQSFATEQGQVTACGEATVCPIDDAKGQLAKRGGLVVGTGTPLMEDVAGITRVAGYDQIDSNVLAQITAERDAPDAMPLPLYLRAPDAKLPGGKSLESA